MNTKGIDRWRMKLINAGTPTDEKNLRQSLILRLKNDLQVLPERKNAVAAAFRRFVSSWFTEEVPANAVPCAIREDVHSERKCVITGIVALAGEMGLAAWVFQYRGIHPLFGIGVAGVVTFILDGLFYLIFDFGKTRRPKEALWKLRRLTFMPASVALGIAIGTTALARYIEGPQALSLLPLFTSGLWVGTVSLLVLSAALFCAGFVFGTTRRLEGEYWRIDLEERITSAFLQEIEWGVDTALAGESVASIQPILVSGSSS